MPGPSNGHWEGGGDDMSGCLRETQMVDRLIVRELDQACQYCPDQHKAQFSSSASVRGRHPSQLRQPTPFAMPRVTSAARPRTTFENAEPDLFESSLSLEEQHIKEGYEQGLSDGRQEGAQEGQELGLQKGFELAQELGFYRGCLKVWEQQSAAHTDLIPARARKAFPGLNNLLDGLSDPNPKDEALQQQLESVRSKFRAVVAIMGIQEDIFPSSTVNSALSF
ncbi:hypothetical protein WJX84_009122 [Apatococcus fuscideae]|uniref:Essential protein Yae1 N-terminal domain-containing protein n=1 Tax=Apatococcus fuscideae TaxID=2026836 RepID=A0AAW1T6Z6_9CHLO